MSEKFDAKNGKKRRKKKHLINYNQLFVTTIDIITPWQLILIEIQE